MSQRIDFFFQKNAQRIEPLFHLNYFFTWLNELNFFLNLTRRVESFLIWLKELDFFFEYDSKNWTFLFFFWIWLKDLNLRLSMTQRSEPFGTWLKDVNFFEHYSENRTLFFLRRRKELNLFLNLTQRIDFSQNDAKNWNPFVFFNNDSNDWTLCKWLKELSFFFEPLLNMTNRVEVFFSLTQRVQLFLCSNMTQRIEPFLSLTPRVEPLF